MDGWVVELVDGWVVELVDGWVGGWLDRWMARWVDGWVGGWMDYHLTDCYILKYLFPWVTGGGKAGGAEESMGE